MLPLAAWSGRICTEKQLSIEDAGDEGSSTVIEKRKKRLTQDGLDVVENSLLYVTGLRFTILRENKVNGILKDTEIPKQRPPQDVTKAEAFMEVDQQMFDILSGAFCIKHASKAASK